MPQIIFRVLIKQNMVHVSCTLARGKFHGLMRPMKLKSSVRPSSKEPKSTPCVHEMTAVMRCWKSNSFDDIPCGKEIQAFVSCVEKSTKTADAKTFKDKSGNERHAVTELNKRMRQFVWKQ